MKLWLMIRWRTKMKISLSSSFPHTEIEMWWSLSFSPVCFLAPFNRFRVLRPVHVSGDAPSLRGLSALPPAFSSSLPVRDVRLCLRVTLLGVDDGPSPGFSRFLWSAFLSASSLNRFSSLPLRSILFPSIRVNQRP